MIEKTPQLHTNTCYFPPVHTHNRKQHIWLRFTNISLPVKAVFNIVKCFTLPFKSLSMKVKFPLRSLKSNLKETLKSLKPALTTHCSNTFGPRGRTRPRASLSEALTDSTSASLLSHVLLPLVLSPLWPIKQHRQAYSWTLAHKGHLSNPIMEQLHLGNTLYKQRTENKEAVKVHDTMHQSSHQHNVKNDQRCSTAMENTLHVSKSTALDVQDETIAPVISQHHSWSTATGR